MRPRANFKGRFTVNVPTANNDKVSLTVDAANVQPWNPQNLTDEQFRESMMQSKTVGGIEWLNGYYNYFGDNGMRFDATDTSGNPIPSIMTSSTLPDGTSPTPSQDPFLTGQVELLGNQFFDKPGQAKMVDLDPVGIYGTQIFSGVFQVTVQTATGPLVMLSAENPTRAYIYDLYMDRNVAPAPPGPQMLAAIWQMALPVAGLTFNFGGQTSPTLSALQTAAQAGQGLVVRYVTYYSTDAFTEAALAEMYKKSGYQKPFANPSSGYIVGTIGAWAMNDPLSTGPSGRLFYGTYPLTRPTSSILFVPTYRDKVPSAPSAAGVAPPPPPPYFLGPIAASVDTANQNVMLDFVSTIPEVTGVSSPPAPGDLAKMNYGALTLTIKSGGQEQTINTIPYESYNRAAYELSGGIIEVAYPSSVANALADPNGTLCLYGVINGVQTLLAGEIAYAAVSTEDRCIYLTANETVTYQMRPLWKGQPMPNQAIQLTISQWQFSTAGTNPAGLVNKQLVPVPGGQEIVSLPASQSYTTDANGFVTFTIKGLEPGAAMIRYQAPGDNFNINQGASPGAPGAPKNFYFGLVSYNMFRVLPDDNFDNIPDSQITWDFVYQNVIRYFYLIYPAMFVRMAFQDEAIAKQNASNIRQFIDESLWSSTSYMPVSRDLSDGKRNLLQRWCTMNEA
jgi:hypothetical protein